MMKTVKIPFFALLACTLFFSLSSCFLGGDDENDFEICRECYANVNGQTVSIEACNSEQEQDFRREYRNHSPRCY